MRLTVTIAAMAGAIALAGAAGAAGDGDAVKLKVNEHPKVGRYLTDSEGRSLYMFTIDSQGSSSCYGDCARVWPPLLSAQSPEAAGDAARKELIGTMERVDGKQQVVYGGHPLYRYGKDIQPGDVYGQDVDGFGGEWYLVAPDGSVIRKQVDGETGKAPGGSERRRASADSAQTRPGPKIQGLPVVTADGARVGTVERTLSHGNTPHDVIVKLEAENHQMGVAADDPRRLPDKATDEPVVAGGDTVALARSDLRRSDDGDALVVSEDSLPTIEDLPG